MAMTGMAMRPYLANDVHSTRAAGDEVGLFAVEFLELGQDALPPLSLDGNRIFGVDVAQRCCGGHFHAVDSTERGEMTTQAGPNAQEAKGIKQDTRLNAGVKGKGKVIFFSLKECCMFVLCTVS